MIKKVSRKTISKLKCVCGLCSHTFENKNCLYNKFVDAKDPRTKMFDILVKIVEDEKRTK